MGTAQHVERAWQRAAERGIAVAEPLPPALPDFCHVDYQTGTPEPGELWPSVLLFDSFAEGGVLDEGLDVCRTVVASLGSLRTIWSVKAAPGSLSWELYVYNRPGLSRVSPADLASALRPTVTVAVPDLLSHVSFDAFSLDLSPAALRGEEQVSAVHVYVPNSTIGRRAGTSYRVDTTVTAQNSYLVFEMPAETDVCAARLAEAPRIGPAGLPADVLELLGATPLVHVAAKPASDGVYVSRVAATSVLGLGGCVPDGLLRRWSSVVPRLGASRVDLGFDLVLAASGGTEVHRTAVFVPL